MKSQTKRRNSRILILVGIMMITFFTLSVEGAFNVAQAFNWGDKKGKGQCLKPKRDQKRPVAFSQAINCGDTIEPGQKVRLKRDLNCADTDFEAAITVEGPAVLDLNGHTITGDPSMDGIVVRGEKAVIKNGKVTACNKGVVLQGEYVEGHHRIFKILAIGNNNDGFAVESDKNKLSHNRSVGNVQEGFDVQGHDNLLERNIAMKNSDKGFEIDGNKNKVRFNKAEANMSDSFEIGGDENRIVYNISKNNEYKGIEINGDLNFIAKNKSINNAGVGIEVDGDENKVRRNILKNNGGVGIELLMYAETNVLARNIAKGNAEFDIQDDNEACEGNRWGNNRFDTSSQDCIH
jgi:hypothetical protein